MKPQKLTQTQEKPWFIILKELLEKMEKERANGKRTKARKSS